MKNMDSIQVVEVITSPKEKHLTCNRQFQGIPGIEIAGNDGLEIAASSAEFADKALHFLKAPGAGRFMHSRRWVCRRYDWEHNLEKLDEHLGVRQPEQRHMA